MAQDWEIIEFWRKILEEFSEEELNELIRWEEEKNNRYEERPQLRIPLEEYYERQEPKKEEDEERGVAIIDYEFI